MPTPKQKIAALATGTAGAADAAAAFIAYQKQRKRNNPRITDEGRAVNTPEPNATPRTSHNSSEDQSVPAKQQRTRSNSSQQRTRRNSSSQQRTRRNSSSQQRTRSSSTTASQTRRGSSSSLNRTRIKRRALSVDDVQTRRSHSKRRSRSKRISRRRALSEGSIPHEGNKSSIDDLSSSQHIDITKPYENFNNIEEVDKEWLQQEGREAHITELWKRWERKLEQWTTFETEITKEINRYLSAVVYTTDFTFTRDVKKPEDEDEDPVIELFRFTDVDSLRTHIRNVYSRPTLCALLDISHPPSQRRRFIVKKTVHTTILNHPCTSKFENLRKTVQKDGRSKPLNSDTYIVPWHSHHCEMKYHKTMAATKIDTAEKGMKVILKGRDSAARWTWMAGHLGSTTLIANYGTVLDSTDTQGKVNVRWHTDTNAHPQEQLLQLRPIQIMGRFANSYNWDLPIVNVSSTLQMNQCLKYGYGGTAYIPECTRFLPAMQIFNSRIHQKKMRTNANSDGRDDRDVLPATIALPNETNAHTDEQRDAFVNLKAFLSYLQKCIEQEDGKMLRTTPEALLYLISICVARVQRQFLYDNDSWLMSNSNLVRILPPAIRSNDKVYGNTYSVFEDSVQHIFHKTMLPPNSGVDFEQFESEIRDLKSSIMNNDERKFILGIPKYHWCE